MSSMTDILLTFLLIAGLVPGQPDSTDRTDRKIGRSVLFSSHFRTGVSFLRYEPAYAFQGGAQTIANMGLRGKMVCLGIRNCGRSWPDGSRIFGVRGAATTLL